MKSSAVPSQSLHLPVPAHRSTLMLRKSHLSQECSMFSGGRPTIRRDVRSTKTVAIARCVPLCMEMPVWHLQKLQSMKKVHNGFLWHGNLLLPLHSMWCATGRPMTRTHNGLRIKVIPPPNVFPDYGPATPTNTR